jgi:hypothetical protein
MVQDATQTGWLNWADATPSNATAAPRFDSRLPTRHFFGGEVRASLHLPAFQYM